MNAGVGFLSKCVQYVLQHSIFEVLIDIPSCHGLKCQYIIVASNISVLT
jgi:hypothetical protein